MIDEQTFDSLFLPFSPVDSAFSFQFEQSYRVLK